MSGHQTAQKSRSTYLPEKSENGVRGAQSHIASGHINRPRSAGWTANTIEKILAQDPIVIIDRIDGAL